MKRNKTFKKIQKITDNFWFFLVFFLTGVGMLAYGIQEDNNFKIYSIAYMFIIGAFHWWGRE